MKTKREQLFEDIKDIFIEVNQLSENVEIKEESSLIVNDATFNMDSLDRVQFIEMIEIKFKISYITDKEIDNVNNFKDLLDLMEKKVK